MKAGISSKIHSVLCSFQVASVFLTRPTCAVLCEIGMLKEMRAGKISSFLTNGLVHVYLGVLIPLFAVTKVSTWIAL